MKWVHLYVHSSAERINENLDRLSAEGWELVTALHTPTGFSLFFKRPKTEPATDTGRK